MSNNPTRNKKKSKRQAPPISVNNVIVTAMLRQLEKELDQKARRKL